jgi:DNA-binding NarL/FixJ family response regulator
MGTSASSNTVVSRTAVLHDSHPVWLEGLEGVMAKLAIEVTGSSTAPELAVDLVQEHRPDLFVCDGAAFLQAHAAAPGLRSVVLSNSSDTGDVEAAFAAGASAYVLKTAHPDDLAAAVRQTFDLSVFTASRISARASRPRHPILRLIAEGLSNGQAARKLWVTEQTIKFHLSNVYRKLGVSNRTEAGCWAHEHGVLAV